MSIRCFLGFHDWQPIPGTLEFVWVNKWISYEQADGKCTRCGQEAHITKETWY